MRDKFVLSLLLTYMTFASPAFSAEMTLEQINAELATREDELRTGYDSMRSINESRVCSTLGDRANYYSEHGQMDLAEADLKRALEIAPENTLALHRRARLFEKLLKFDLAERDWSKAIQLQSDALSYNCRAELYETMSDYVHADADWSKALELSTSKAYPDTATLKAKRAEFFEKRLEKKEKKGELTEEDLNRAVEMSPEKFLRKRFHYYEKNGKLDLAEADLNRGAALKEGAAFYLQDRSGFYEKQGKIQLAEADINRAASMDPKWCLGARAEFYERQGKLELADADWKRAVELNSDFALRYRAAYSERQKRFLDALADWSRIAETKPALGLSSRALLLEKQSRFQEAEADWSKLVQTDAGGWLGNRASCYEKQGKNELAEADLNRGVTLTPKKEGYLVLRANFFERTGKADLAEADWNKIVQLEPIWALDDRADFYERQGKFELAMQDIDEALAKEKKFDPELRLQRIRVLGCLGKKELAEGAARELLAVDQPNGKDDYRYSRRKATSLLVLGQAKEAVSELLNPKFDADRKIDWLGQSILGSAYEFLGDKASACRAYERALELYGEEYRFNLIDRVVAEQSRRRLVALGKSPSMQPIAHLQGSKAIPAHMVNFDRTSGSVATNPKISAGKNSAVQNSTASVTGQAQRGKADRPVKDKWALIIGISQFSNPQYNLKFAAKDAQDFANFLIKDAGFRRDHVRILLNADATRRNIVSSFGSKWLPNVTDADDLVVVYVSTHGTPAHKDRAGKNYIVAYDTEAEDPYATGVNMDEVYEAIRDRVKTDRALIVMDTCYSGGAVPGSRSLKEGDNFDFSKISLGSGHVVVSSSSVGERSWESKNYSNGIFTKHLIETLRENGTKFDLHSIFQKLQEKVKWEVKRDFGVEQTPQVGGKWEGNDLFLSVQTAAPRDAGKAVYEGLTVPATTSRVGPSKSPVTATPSRTPAKPSAK